MKKGLFLLFLAKLLRLRAFYIRKQHRIRKEYNTFIEFQSAKYSFWNKIVLNKVLVYFKKYDLTIKIEELSIGFDLRNLIQGKIAFKTIGLKSIYLNLGESPFFSSNAEKSNIRSLKKGFPNFLNYIRLLAKMSHKVVKVAETISFSDIKVYSRSGANITIEAAKMNSSDNKQHIMLKSCLVNLPNRSKFTLNLIDISYKIHRQKNDYQSFELNSQIKKLISDSPLLCAERLEYNDLSMSLVGKLTEKEFRIENQSFIKLSKITSFISMSVSHKEIRLCTELVQHSLDSILSTFNKFTNKEIYALKATGTIGLTINLLFDIKEKSNSIFNIKLQRRNFDITDFEKLNFQYLHNAFEHKIFERDQYIRSVYLWEQNKYYIKLDDIPDNLIRIIILNEDPNFIFHKGIDANFIGLAIITNLTERKFSRGASTITMQLSRNLFLNHHKNIYRKLEETIISLLLENVYQISKERILEIYLNIIELGPKIYGIAEAADFYFGKHPKELTLTEFIVISYIIPRPKHFIHAVKDNSKILVKNLRQYIKRVSFRLLNLGMIDQEQFDNIDYRITFSHELENQVLIL